MRFHSPLPPPPPFIFGSSFAVAQSAPRRSHMVAISIITFHFVSPNSSHTARSFPSQLAFVPYSLASSSKSWELQLQPRRTEKHLWKQTFCSNLQWISRHSKCWHDFPVCFLVYFTLEFVSSKSRGGKPQACGSNHIHLDLQSWLKLKQLWGNVEFSCVCVDLLIFVASNIPQGWAIARISDRLWCGSNLTPCFQQPPFLSIQLICSLFEVDNESQHFCNALLSSPLLKIKEKD